jgi:hypothetical protein
MTALSPDERAAELQWIVRLVFAAGLALCLWGRDDLGLVAFAMAFFVWLFS